MTLTEKHLDIPTPDGQMNSFVVHPATGTHPVVLFYMDAPGKREELHTMARRIAAAGYYVVLPNLYYRRTRDFWVQERTPEVMATMSAHMRATTIALNMIDTGAMLAFVDAQPEVDAARIGAVGYCMSGPLVVAAAAAYPDRFRAIASFYGVNMATTAPDSPHLLAARLKCECYIACAELDKLTPRFMMATFEAALKANGLPYTLEWYPGVDHGFAFPQRAAYNEPAAELHWRRLLGLFDRVLHGR